MACPPDNRQVATEGCAERRWPEQSPKCGIRGHHAIMEMLKSSPRDCYPTVQVGEGLLELVDVKSLAVFPIFDRQQSLGTRGGL